MRENIGRTHPAKGVYIFRDHATIVFLTVCTRQRQKILATDRVHVALLKAWRNADTWLVGNYVVMPDHLHLFCAPKNEEYTVEQWVTFWKREFRRAMELSAPAFQAHCFHHRLRREESCHDKWNYVRNNPVRANLVKETDDWPTKA